MTFRVTSTFNSDEIYRKIRGAIGIYGLTAAQKCEAYAKKNAPWYPKRQPAYPNYTYTNNARNSIQGKFKWDSSKAQIELSGNVSYFVYLELAHEKKWAILLPTIRELGPDILNGYSRLIK